jgi:hypothetical protein
MRGLLISAAGVLLTTAATADVPDPSRSSVGLEGQGTACHYRFRTDGGLDQLAVHVTLRDAFDTPISNCSTTVTLGPDVGTIAFGTCCENPRTAHTDPWGVARIAFFQIGGRGSLELRVTAHCIGAYEVGIEAIDFTSPDLDASGGQSVIDLGLWAGCYPPAPYCKSSDYDCNGTVDVLDLGTWAGGLGLECGQTPCP